MVALILMLICELALLLLTRTMLIFVPAQTAILTLALNVTCLSVNGFDDIVQKEARDGKPKGIVPPVALDPKDKTNDMIGSGHDERDGELYHLVACKIKDGSGGFFGSKTKLIQWVYVKAPSVASLAAEMEALADFASLPRPRKLAARLELLACEEQANKYLLLPTAFFKVIDEPRTTTGAVAEDGCGFVPPELLADIARSMPGNKHVHQPLAIQVYPPEVSMISPCVTPHNRCRLHALCHH